MSTSEYKKYVHPSVKLCPVCRGKEKEYLYHEDDLLNQEPVKITCRTCNGSGRVVISKEITTIINIEPYK